MELTTGHVIDIDQVLHVNLNRVPRKDKEVYKVKMRGSCLEVSKEDMVKIAAYLIRKSTMLMDSVRRY